MLTIIAAAIVEATAAGDPSVAKWGIIAAMVTTVFTSLFAWLNSRTAKQNSKEAVKHAAETVVQVQAIHKATNSDRAIMVAKMDRLEEVITKMTLEKYAMIEQARSTAEATPELIRLLILDDDPAFLEIVTEFLAKDTDGNYKIDTATDHKTAEALFLKREHDVYLVDYRLKDESGADVSGLKFISSLRGASHMGPFILLSAFVDESIKKQALNEGVQMVVTKESVIRGNLGRDVRFAIQAFRAAQRAKQ